MSNIYLHLPNGKALPVQLSAMVFGNNVHITVATSQPHVKMSIRGHRSDVLEQLLKLYDSTRAKPVSEWLFNDQVLKMTPADVVKYFEQSPHLNSMADDVRAALSKHPEYAAAAPEDPQLTSDLEKCRHLEQPSKADISEVLTGDRYYSGSLYTRVSKVYDALNSSSDEKEEVLSEERDNLAA